MRRQPARFCLLGASAIAVLLLAHPMSPGARAQSAPPPAPAPGADAQQTTDPPVRVGRLAAVGGTVSYREPDADQWSAAGLNYPVAAGESLWTEPNASAQMEFGASRIVMAGGTEFDLGSLDDTGLQAIVPQGEVYLHTQRLGPSESWAVQTPRGLVMLAEPGRYGIAVGDAQNPTTVTVLDGSAQISGPGVGLHVGPGQTATVAGTNTFTGSVGPAQTDPFLTATVQAEEEHAPSQAGAPAAVAQIPGASDLTAYGSWAQTSGYGPIWYPQVEPGWVPYRDGYWAYMAPWGWTWIDDEPWGFAPMHYGRWVEIGGRWGWTPGLVATVAPPVYAPALVTFFGIGGGVAVGIGAALAEGSVGWCPLGPREAYHPWYRASDRYWRAVNGGDIGDVSRDVGSNNFVNRHAMTVVPASMLSESRRVRGLAGRVDQRILSAAHPVFGRDPVRPTAATLGVTRRFAQRMHLAAPPAGLAPVHRFAAPGPTSRNQMAIGNGPLQREPMGHAVSVRRAAQPAVIASHSMARWPAPAHSAAMSPREVHPAPMHAVMAQPRVSVPQPHPAPAPRPVFHVSASPPAAPRPAPVTRPAPHAQPERKR